MKYGSCGEEEEDGTKGLVCVSTRVSVGHGTWRRCPSNEVINMQRPGVFGVLPFTPIDGAKWRAGGWCTIPRGFVEWLCLYSPLWWDFPDAFSERFTWHGVVDIFAMERRREKRNRRGCGNVMRLV